MINPLVGCSYIGRTPIYRIVVSNHDREPLCWHHHETYDEAANCKQAIEKFNFLQQPKDNAIVTSTTE